MKFRNAGFWIKLVLFISIGSGSFGQNALVGSGFSTGWGACGQNWDFRYFSASAGNSYSSGVLAPNGSGDQYWRIGVDWSGTLKQLNSLGSGPDQGAGPNTVITLNPNCTTNGAFFRNVSSTANRYVFKTRDAGSNPSNQFVYFEIQGDVRSVTSVTQSPASGTAGSGIPVTVTAYLNGSLNLGQAVYLRYSGDNFASSIVIPMTGSGTEFTGVIPGTFNTAGTQVSYYVFTSGDANVAGDGSNADFFTINLNNNSGVNYSYTVQDWVALYDHEFGTGPIAAHPFTDAPGLFHPNLSGSSWSNSWSSWTNLPGATGQAIAFQPANLLATSVTLSFTVAPGFQCELNAFDLWMQRSSNGPTQLNSITVNGTQILAGPVSVGTTGAFNGITQVANAVSGLTGNVSVIILCSPPSGTGSDFRLDDFRLYGNVTPVAGTPPVITSFSASPNNGSTLEGFVGSTISISGSGFLGTQVVRLGGSGGTSLAFTIVDDNTLTFSPGTSSGVVYVENPFGNATSSSSFTNLGYLTVAAGSWSNPLTWLGGSVPNTGMACTVAHSLSLDHTVSPVPTSMEIAPLGSLDFTGFLSVLNTKSFTNEGMVSFSGPGSLLLQDGGSIVNNGTWLSGTGTVFFLGNCTVAGANGITFQVLQLFGGVSFKTTPTIAGTLAIRSGGYVASPGPPVYAAGSTLLYNTGGPYGRFQEWISKSGAGFPHHVRVMGGTSLDLQNGGNPDLATGGNFIVDAGSSASMGNSSAVLSIEGNMNLSGTFTQSTSIGGDLVLAGNWNSTGTATLISNNRDVRFNGTGSQTILTSGSLTFGYLTIDNPGSGVDLLSTLYVGTFRVNPGRTFNLNSDKIVVSEGGGVLINGIFNANTGTIEFANGGSFTNNGTFNRGFSTLDFKGTSAGNVTGTVQTNFHNIRLFPGGGVDFNSGPLRGRVSGTLQLRPGSFVANNAPIYEPGSKLMYSGGGTYNRNVEWDPATVQKVEITANTTLNCGVNGTTFSHILADSLIIQTGSTLTMTGPDMTAPLVVGGNLFLAGTLQLSQASGGDLEVGGDFVNQNGTFECNERLVTFIGSQNASVKGFSQTTFCFLTVDKSSNATLKAEVPFSVSRPPAGSTLHVSGGVLDLNGQILTLGAGNNTLWIDSGFANSQTLRTGGSDITGFTTFRSRLSNADTLGGKVDYSGPGPENLIFPVKGYFMLWVTQPALKMVLQNIRVEDSLWIGPGTTLDFGSLSSTLECRGHVVNHGLVTGTGTGKILLAGVYTQNINGSGTYRNLEIQNGNAVYSFGNPVVSGKLALLEGKIFTGPDTIFLGNNATLTETVGPAGEHFVRGQLKTTRMVGTNAETFGGMGMELTAGSNLGTVTAIRQSGTPMIGTYPCCDGFVSISRVWTLTPSVQPSLPDRNLYLSWPSEDDNGQTINGLQLWKSEDGILPTEAIGFPQDVSSGNPRVLEYLGVLDFATFTGSGDIPLPLELVRFSGRKEGRIAVLKWEMASEGKVRAYRLERSLDGSEFQFLTRISVQEPLRYYQYSDPISEDTYYRLVIEYLDGKTEGSDPVFIRTDEREDLEVSIIPNPSGGTFRIEFSRSKRIPETIGIRLTNMEGKEIQIASGNPEQINGLLGKMSRSMPRGVYSLRIATPDKVRVLRLVKSE